MSTRYVWQKCEAAPPALEFKLDTSSGELGLQSGHSGSYGVAPILCKKVKIIITDSSEISAYFAPDGDYTTLTSGYYSCAEYPYVIVRWNNNYNYGDYCGHSTSGYWSDAGTSTNYARVYKSTSKSTTSRVNFNTMRSPTIKEFTKGPAIELVSSSNSSAFNAGINGKLWYDYLGSDNIDPTGITYLTDGIRPGNQIKVSVTPRSNTYGGTISYLYQYSLNGGSWTTIQTTTATSVNFTVPANAKSLQFRVRAQDNMGFTSTTYVTGDTVGVERLNAYVGVSNKARKGVELYVGVNGKARKVVGAWVGVNGKARRFL